MTATLVPKDTCWWSILIDGRACWRMVTQLWVFLRLPKKVVPPSCATASASTHLWGTACSIAGHLALALVHQIVDGFYRGGAILLQVCFLERGSRLHNITPTHMTACTPSGAPSCAVACSPYSCTLPADVVQSGGKASLVEGQSRRTYAVLVEGPGDVLVCMSHWGGHE